MSNYNSRLPYGGAVSYSAPAMYNNGEMLFDQRVQNIDSDASAGYIPIELGTILQTRYGLFRYVEFADSTAAAAGELLVPAALISVTACATSSDLLQITGTAGAAIGKNQFRGGIAYVSAGTGEGQAMFIIGNTAAASAASVTIHLEQPLTAAVASGTTLLGHPYRARRHIGTASGDYGGVGERPIGISVGVISAIVSSGMHVSGGKSYYGWVQVAGLCPRALVTAATPAASALSGYLTPAPSTAASLTPIANGATPDDVSIVAQAIWGAGSTFDVAVPARLFFE